MKAKDIQKVAVVGAGLMGSGIALEYAIAGLEVKVVDVTPEIARRSLGTIASKLDFLAGKGLIDEVRCKQALEGISAADGLDDAVVSADLVVECVLEKLGLKQEIFGHLEAVCKADAILATNTSGISITRISSRLQTAHRVVGTHYWNPPYLMPLVEVIAGERTSSETVATVGELLQRIGKIPIIVRKEIPGFVWNRLQFALLRECFHLVEQGVVSVEDIDLVVKKGLGRRLSLIGPFETADIGGLDTFLSVGEYLLPELSCQKQPSQLFTDKIRRGELGTKSGKGFYSWSQDRIENTQQFRSVCRSRAARRAEKSQVPVPRCRATVPCGGDRYESTARLPALTVPLRELTEYHGSR